MTIDYQNTVEDLVDLTIFQMEKANQGSRERMLMQFLVPGAMLGYLLWNSSQTGQEISFTSPFFTLAVTWVFLMPYVFRRVLRYRLTKRFQGQNDSPLVLPRTLTVDPDEVTETYNGRTLRYAWTDVDRMEVIGSCVALLINDKTTILIPRRAFDSMKNMSRFVRAVEAKIHGLTDPDEGESTPSDRGQSLEKGSNPLPDATSSSNDVLT